MASVREAHRLAGEIVASLREQTDPLRRDFTRGYFPSALENLGVSAPKMRAAVAPRVKREVRHKLQTGKKN